MMFVEDLLSFKVATIPAAWGGGWCEVLFLWVVEEEPCWCSSDPLHKQIFKLS